jgi:hypothetical protein
MAICVRCTAGTTTNSDSPTRSLRTSLNSERIQDAVPSGVAVYGHRVKPQLPASAAGEGGRIDVLIDASDISSDIALAKSANSSKRTQTDEKEGGRETADSRTVSGNTSDFWPLTKRISQTPTLSESNFSRFSAHFRRDHREHESLTLLALVRSITAVPAARRLPSDILK